MRAVLALLLLSACDLADDSSDVVDDTESDDTPVDTEPPDTEDTEPPDTEDTEPPDTEDTEPSIDADNDGAPADVDCDDNDPAVRPGAAELCDGIDQDCNGRIDDGVVPPTWRLDRDGDGFGDAAATWSACVVPPFFVPDLGPADCDDLDPNVRPGVPEIAGDGVDQDCDGVEDCWADADADGWGAGSAAPGRTLDCTGLLEAGNGLDCDDGDLFVYPRAPELCGTIDRDCDGAPGNTDPDATDRLTYFRDADGDGYGDPLAEIVACLPPEGSTPDASDCNDDLASISPAAEERCNQVDDDCDAFVDDGDDDVIDPPLWYRDQDRDGFGTADSTRLACAALAPWDTRNTEDCNDALAFVRPGANEAFGNTLDEDCDGRLGCYIDADLDGLPGFSTALVPGPTCDVAGYGFSGGDCDDDDATLQQFRFYADSDRDGWGNPSVSVLSCAPPAFFVARTGDCDDTRTLVRPDAPEVPANAQDDDCDGLEACYEDLDRDLAGTSVPVASVDLDCNDPGEAPRGDDCNDADRLIRPGALEAIGDGVDSDCDGRELCFLDQDGDRWGGRTFLAVPGLSCDVEAASDETGDCNDADASVSPSAAERCGGVDRDCDGLVADEDPDVQGAPVWFRDADGDALGDEASPRAACARPEGHVEVDGDCDDTRAQWGLTCPFAEIAVGDVASCARRTDGELVCLDLPDAPPRADRVVASGGAVCVLDAGALACAGEGPVQPPSGRFVDLALGPDAGCAVSEAGAITCWGSDEAGLVSGVPDLQDAVGVAVGPREACAVRSTGALACWGEPTCEGAPAPATAPALGPDQACALADGRLDCALCGADADWPSEPLLRWLDLDSDLGGTCAITVSGDVACFGGSLDAGPERAVQVDVGTTTACAVLEDGHTTCWAERVR